MKIGVFDSGMGGLIIAQSLIRSLPEYDYVYLGDTARVPYGSRSSDRVHEYTQQGINFLFNQGCQLIVLACNTASSEALRRIQQHGLPPDKKVLGVLIPAAEEAVNATGSGVVGVIGTTGTIASKAYVLEMAKLNDKVKVVQMATPLLVPLVEYQGEKWARQILQEYLQPLLEADIDTLVLGCTHYPVLKEQIQELTGSGVHLISPDEFIGSKIRSYLERHPEIADSLSKGSGRQYFVTDKTSANTDFAKGIDPSISLQPADID